jgi:hypothetical protein
LPSTQQQASDRSTEVLSVDTELTNGLSAVSLDSGGSNDSEGGNNDILEDIEGHDISFKEKRLEELFPTEKTSEISYVLKKCDGSFTRAMDILLNHVFFNGEDSGDGQGKIPLRGIDAFSDEHFKSTPKRRKPKKKKYQPLSEADVENDGSQSPNKWASFRADIDFIVSMTGISEQTVSSIYHSNGAQRARTITAILDRDHSKQGKCTEEALQEAGVIELLDEFPVIPIHYLAAIMRLTRPSSANAHSLAKALVSPLTSGSSAPLQIIPQYTRYKEENGSPGTRSAPSSGSSTPINGNATTLAFARGTAFTNASQYYRKGNSSNLLGAAAAYYSQLGRDYDSALKTATAAEADALVAAQSSSTVLDLHGVSVKDATRIATERVNTWWHDLGEGRLPGPKSTIGPGYRIVTGLGRHSNGGVGKLGPAVARALVRGGWKVVVGSGEIVVMGIVRK